MKILGLSAYYHDSAAALVNDGDIVSASQEERFTRKKHDASFPRHAVASCLEAAGLKMSDIGLVAFYENPALKFNRIVESLVSQPGLDVGLVEAAIDLWTSKKLWQEDDIRRELGYAGKIIFPAHHLSHAASAFYPSPFQSAAILTLDGVGEWMTTTIGRGAGNRIDILRHLDFPHSLGMLYSAFTYYAGFKVNSGEYKLMGLAPYGRPVYAKKIIDHLIDVKSDGSFRLNMKYFGYASGGKMITPAFADLFGRPARRAEDPVTQIDMDIAKSIQVVTEDIVLKMARTAMDATGERRLCMAGGVALNCVANGRIQRELGLDGLWIQPAAGDAGGALGASLYGWFQHHDQKRESGGSQDRQKGSYLGPRYSVEHERQVLDSLGAVYSYLPDDSVLLEEVAKAIASGKVVGHFAGAMEFGPRALGNRSILGDPRSPEMQKTMNLKIKYRESFRPFAPSVIEEKARDYFCLNGKSPYMLLTAPISDTIRLPLGEEQKEKFGLDLLYVHRSELPAITHVDFSARVQSVSSEVNPRFHALISRVGEKTGHPVVINTSFNVRGEPIVCTPFDAYACFMNTGMDVLVIDNFLMWKEGQPAWDSTRQNRNFEAD